MNLWALSTDGLPAHIRFSCSSCWNSNFQFRIALRGLDCDEVSQTAQNWSRVFVKSLRFHGQRSHFHRASSLVLLQYSDYHSLRFCAKFAVKFRSLLFRKRAEVYEPECQRFFEAGAFSGSSRRGRNHRSWGAKWKWMWMIGEANLGSSLRKWCWRILSRMRGRSTSDPFTRYEPAIIMYKPHCRGSIPFSNFSLNSFSRFSLFVCELIA